MGNWQSKIGNPLFLLLLILGRRFAFIFLLTLADHFRFSGLFAFSNWRRSYFLFLNDADRCDHSLSVLKDFHVRRCA